MRQRGCGQVLLGVLFVVAACAVFGALAGAMVRTGEIPLHGPKLTGFQPDPNQPFLPSTPITFTFDQPMQPASVEAAISIESTDRGEARRSVPGAFQWNQGHTQVTFVPEQDGFAPGASYVIQLRAGAKAGTLPRTTTDSVEWTVSLPPLLISQTLPPGEQNVAAWPVLQATFAYALDCGATLATFAIEPQAAGALDCDGQTVTFSPTLPLAPGTAYLAEVGSVTLAGELWPRPGVTWAFETAPPLAIVDASPADGASLTDLWTPVRIAFSRPVVAESVRQRFTLAGEDGSPLAGQATWEDQGATLVFEPEDALTPAGAYQFSLQAGVADELGFELAEPLAHTFGTEPLLTEIAPRDGARGVQLDSEVRVVFSRPMDQASVERGLTFTPALAGDTAWEGNTLVYAPRGGFTADTQYEATVSGDVLDASGAPLAEPHTWSFATQSFLLGARPSSGATISELRRPLAFKFALPMDRGSVERALTVSPETAVDLTWSNEDRAVSIHPDPAWLPGAEYQVILAESARTADGLQTMGQDRALTFSTTSAEVQFGQGPNVQVMDAAGERAFQVIFRGADVADYQLVAITPTQFLDLYSSGFRGIGPQEAQVIDTNDLTLAAEWRDGLIPVEGHSSSGWQVAEARIPADVPPGIYILASTMALGSEELVQDSLLVILTDHTLVLKEALAGSGSRAEAGIVAWDTAISDGSPVVSATVRVYDRDGSFLAEGTTGDDGLLDLDVPGDPGPLIALSEKDGDWTACGLSNEWSEAGFWWWWTEPASRPLHTIYSYTERPIYRPAQTIYFKDYVRADDDVSYTLPGPDIPITVRLRDARDNVAASQVLTPTRFGTVYGEFQLADEPILGTWNLETELEGTVARQALKVEEYRKPEYEVSVHIPQETYIHGEDIGMTVDAAYYFGEPVADAQVVLQVYPTYADSYFSEDELRVGYPILTEQGRTDADGQWTMQVPTEDVFGERSRARQAMLTLEATVTDEAGQSVSSYETIVVQRTSQGLTLLLEKHGYQPSETLSFSAMVRDRDGNPAAGVELTAEVLGWDDQIVAGGQATTGDSGQAFFSVNLTEQGWYGIRVTGTDDGGREIMDTDYAWLYDPTGQAPWYQGQWAENPALTVSADRSTYAVGEDAQVVIYAPAPGPALLTFERGKTRHAEPITLISGTNLITIPIRADFAPNIDITVSQFGPLSSDPGQWGIQSRPEAQLNRASAQILVPMTDRLLTVTLTTDQESYAPGEVVTYHVQVSNQEGQPVVAEVSLAVVDEAIYALAKDMSRDPFEVFYAPRPNTVRTFDSLHPTRWLFPEGPGLGGGDGDEGGAPRRDFLDTALWTPTVVTDEHGKAAVTFELPDNLTEWRALARAVTTDTLVGHATTSIVVSKEIVVRPALPRFLVQGDTITLTAVVHNFGASPAWAMVELEVEGLVPAGKDGQVTEAQVVEIPAGGSATVGWPVRAETLSDDAQGAPTDARVMVQATASVGARKVGSDAVALSIPILPLAVPEVATLAGTLTPDRPTETITITLPPDAIEGLSRLEINLAPSVAPGLLSGLEYLIDYPFG